MRKKRVWTGVLGIVLILAVFFGYLSWRDGKDTPAASVEEKKAEGEKKPFEGITLTILNHSSATPDGVFDKTCEAAEEKFGFDIEIESCSEDTIVKTRLATGQCPDLLVYNTGSLLYSLHPEEFFMDLTDAPFVKNLDEDFIQAASVDGVLYGIPQSDNMGCGVYYNKELYEKYDLQAPETWEEFKKNMDVLQKAGIAGMGIALRDLVSVQLPFLADNYQLMKENPDFAEDFQNGTSTFAGTEEGLRSWERYEELIPYFNEDAISCSLKELQEKLFEDQVGHMIYFTNLIPEWEEKYGEECEKIGFFALPGDDKDSTGMTVWPANGIYGNKKSENKEAIEAFMAWYISDEGMDVLTSFYHPVGIFHTGYQPGQEQSQLVEDTRKYYQEGDVVLALEYLIPMKGINCQEICNKLGSGQLTAKEAAEAYDEDCKKAALQCGLWS
ncbi:MAG: ABC transporter substrate-binding protein [Bacillota bacterium]|nr:ABC transporter substrate-binding protein [Bacillota bacterium]